MTSHETNKPSDAQVEAALPNNIPTTAVQALADMPDHILAQMPALMEKERQKVAAQVDAAIARKDKRSERRLRKEYLLWLSHGEVIGEEIAYRKTQQGN